MHSIYYCKVKILVCSTVETENMEYYQRVIIAYVCFFFLKISIVIRQRAHVGDGGEFSDSFLFILME